MTAAELRTVAGLDTAAFGTLYAAATLAGAVCLYGTGALIDRTALPVYVAGPVLLLALGCGLMASADSVVALALGLFLLRFAGQGLMSHAAVISIARVFDAARLWQ